MGTVSLFRGMEGTLPGTSNWVRVRILEFFKIFILELAG